MYILMTNPYFQYDFFKSFHISITLTNEYTTAWYYFTAYIRHLISPILGSDCMNQIIQSLQDTIDKIGNLSDTESGLSFLNDVLKFFY